jgi:hypothetical protein
MNTVTTNRYAKLLLAVAIVVSLAGCQPPAATKGPTDKEAAHDHAHHGPHGGHIMEIGKEEYHAEWTHEESGKVTFYLLDSAVKKDVPIAADEITIDVQVGKNEPVTYKLAAVDPQDGKSATFEIIDKNLLGVLETLKDNKGTVLTLNVTIDGKTFAQKIEEHDHGHAH